MFDETTGSGEQNNAPEGQTTETGERVAFCQQCGKGLTNATIRRAGSAVYCEPCLVARLEGSAASGAGPTAAGWTPVSGAGPATATAGGPAGVPTGNEPSPWLAAFLGLIPGVGAMYNGQYAKGVAHLVIFAVLSSLSRNVNDIFGLLVAGWIFYQAFDAYHTAAARRDGTTLPNPFGLNDIGDRMGFGKNWPGSAARPVTSSTTAGWASATAGPTTATASQGPAGGPGWSGYVAPTNFGATATPRRHLHHRSLRRMRGRRIPGRARGRSLRIRARMWVRPGAAHRECRFRRCPRYLRCHRGASLSVQRG